MFIYFFIFTLSHCFWRERKEEKEALTQGKSTTCLSPTHAWTGDGANNPGTCPDHSQTRNILVTSRYSNQGTKAATLGRTWFFLESPGRESAFLPFPASRDCLHSQVSGLLPYDQHRRIASSNLCPSLSLSLPLSPSYMCTHTPLLQTPLWLCTSP